MTILTAIPRPWNYHSGVHNCATCNGLGVVSSQTRATTWDPYPETPCPDCDGVEHEAECAVCGSTLEMAGYDCFVCQTVDELPANVDADALTKAIRTALDARLAFVLNAKVAA